MSLVDNLAVDSGHLPATLGDGLGFAASSHARNTIPTWRDYSKTPLRQMPALAAKLGVRELLYKDEASRFGLGSFKALGGAYAVFRLLAEHIHRETGRQFDPAAMFSDEEAQRYASSFTVACATAGNHGRSVAWGASMFGCPCRIFVHGGVGAERIEAMAAFGAAIEQVDGTYDNSVRAAADAAALHGWTIVSDTSYPGYTTIPLFVMQGYTVMLQEITEVLVDEPPSHIFVQAGVGGLAAAVCAHFWDRYGVARPRLIVVEPSNAACLQASAVSGGMATVPGNLETCMLGLACGEPSQLAWDVLSRGAHHFLAVDDADVADTMRALHAGYWGGERVVAGESAVAGIIGLVECSERRDWRRRIGLTVDSRVLVFGTEGNTDPAIYERIVAGCSGDDQESVGNPRNPREARTR